MGLPIPTIDLLYYKIGIFVIPTFPWHHSFITGGHFGYLRTYKHILRGFYWPSLKTDVKHHVAACDTYQRINYETIRKPGPLQPLPIPLQTWTNIAMDFIEGLPSIHGRNVILVVVDHLSKYGHFISTKHPYSAAKIDDVFIAEVFHLHGMPAAIVSDRDLIFVTVWHITPNLMGNLRSLIVPLSIVYTALSMINPNHGFNGFLAEWWYNSTFHSAIQSTPFEVVYGYPAPPISAYLPGSSPVHLVDSTLHDRDALLSSLCANLQLGLLTLATLSPISSEQNPFPQTRSTLL